MRLLHLAVHTLTSRPAREEDEVRRYVDCFFILWSTHHCCELTVVKRTFDELSCCLEEENKAASLRATRGAIAPHRAADVHSLSPSLWRSSWTCVKHWEMCFFRAAISLTHLAFKAFVPLFIYPSG